MKPRAKPTPIDQGQVFEPSKVPRCGICIEPLGDPTKSSYEGKPVHNSCFERKGGWHRAKASPSRRFRRTRPIDAKSLKQFARTTPEGQLWLSRKAVL